MDTGWFYILDIADERLTLCDDGEPYPFNNRFLASDLCEDGQSVTYIHTSNLDEWRANGWARPEGWIKQTPKFDCIDPFTANLNDLV
jgi:hypothetical protein